MRIPFPYLVAGYQQYTQVYPQKLCITFSYADAYPLNATGKKGFIRGFF